MRSKKQEKRWRASTTFVNDQVSNVNNMWRSIPITNNTWSVEHGAEASDNIVHCALLLMMMVIVFVGGINLIRFYIFLLINITSATTQNTSICCRDTREPYWSHSVSLNRSVRLNDSTRANGKKGYWHWFVVQCGALGLDTWTETSNWIVGVIIGFELPQSTLTLLLLLLRDIHKRTSDFVWIVSTFWSCVTYTKNRSGSS